jgi:hypothetical protein
MSPVFPSSTAVHSPIDPEPLRANARRYCLPLRTSGGGTRHMTIRLRGPLLAIGMTAALAGCTTVVVGTIEPTDLATALAVDVPGFTPTDAPEQPDTVCREGSYNGTVPSLDPDLGTATATGYGAEEAELGAWAWRTDSAEAAAALVDAVTADLDACQYDVYYDSDTDGDGELDAGGHEQQHAREWSDGTWTGLAVDARTESGGVELTETRFARSADVVVLVVLTSTDGRADSLPATVEAYLDAVAGRLG